MTATQASLDADLGRMNVNRIATQILQNSTDVDEAISWTEGRLKESFQKALGKKILERLYDIKYPLKFRPDFHGPIYTGKKTATTRRTQKLNVGDLFYVPPPPFEYARVRYVESLWEIVRVETGTIENLCSAYYREENYSSPFQMYNALKNIYPSIGPLSQGTTYFFQPHTGGRRL